MGMPISSGGGYSAMISQAVSAPPVAKAPPPPPPAPEVSALQMLATSGTVGTRLNTSA